MILKILFLGDSNVGKSCLIKRFIDNEFDNRLSSTICIDFKIKRIKEEDLKLYMWEITSIKDCHSFFKDANGIFISATNKKIGLSLFNNIKFKLIGSAHNQLEYFIKKRQSCKTIMLSPIFYNEKYSVNKILNPIKFNLISLDWKIDLCALGGLAEENIGKIKMTKAKAIGVKSLVNKR